MNSSLITADGATHLKILIISLLAAIVVIWIGISARTSHAAILSEPSRVNGQAMIPAPCADLGEHATIVRRSLEA
jgi:hypothetical protein